MKKSSGKFFETVWALIMVAVVSSTLTMLILGHTSDMGATHWVSDDEYETIKRYEKLDNIRKTLMQDYYVELDEDALLLGAIRGMTGAAEDPYTFYYTPEELAIADENSEGVYHGIGILIQHNEEGMIEVLRVYEDGPAHEAGMKPGDLIVAVDDFLIEGADARVYDEAVKRVRGEDGTQVVLTVSRDGNTLKIPVTRSDVSVSYAEHCMIGEDIGYISITQFTGDASENFKEAIEEFEKNGVKGMVIDLRNNPGGLLTEVVEIADSILPEGVIVYTEDRAGKREDFYSDKDMCDIPLTVLVNDMSASASELLAAAVKSFDRGEIVGVTTYGKGIVQTRVDFAEDGSAIQLTTSSYYAGDGTSIHQVGVEPDFVVPLDMSYVPVDPDPVSDNQLAKALEILRATEK
ncbi:MAG: S41 family peptidase [Clostridia bacterium]|nr:S41 family peptidase [Clostridia bacterium]